MFKQTAIWLTWFLAGLIGGLGAVGHSQTLRLEATTGVTKHHLAPEGAWHYSGFETNNKLLVGSYQVGLLWLPIKSGDWSLGVRGAYADLGKVRASNSFPVIEDRSSADARVNPICDRSTLHGCTGRFDGIGKTKGWSIGPALERDFGGGVSVGIEAGAYIYWSNWRASNIRVVDGRDEFTPPMWQNFTWDSAKGQHVTSYVGGNARWHNLFFSARLYSQVHAADTAKCNDCIGMTSGPIWSAMAGISIAL